MAERLHPLAELAANAVRCADVDLVAMPPARRLIIRADATMPNDLGMPLPAPCRAVTEGDRSLLWLGPDEFLLLAPEDFPDPPGRSVAWVDISHRDAAIGVCGPRAAWALNTFCALDLHLAAFPVGMCARTLLGKAQITLWRTGVESFRVETARSLAAYVWSCLEEARREFLA